MTKHLLFLQLNFKFFDFNSKILGKFFDLALDIELESSALAAVLHQYSGFTLFSNEERWGFHSNQVDIKFNLYL